MSGAAAGPAAPRGGWRHRIPWPPILVALAAAALFHLIVGLTSPGYWTHGVWDEAYYLRVAEFGYEIPRDDFLSFGTSAFSPGWPTLLRVAHELTGIALPPLRSILAVFCFVAGCCGLWQVFARIGGERREHLAALLLFAFWPGSLFFLSGYAEALYFPLLTWFTLALSNRRWLLAAWLAAAACFVRTPAVVLFAVLGLSLWHDTVRQLGWRAGTLAALGAAAWIGPIALLAPAGYMALLWADTNDPVAFLPAYDAWAPHRLEDLRNWTFGRIAEGIQFHFGGQIGRWLGFWFFVTAPIVLFVQRLRMPPVLMILAAASWLFFLSQNVIEVPYENMLRWMAIVFPIHLAWVWTLRPLHLMAPVLLFTLWLWLRCVARFVDGHGWVS
jgi:hypothetical protein